MNKKKLLVIGSNSDIAKAGMDLLNEYDIVKIDRSTIDLNDHDSTEKIQNLLKEHNPDVILHSAGVFGENDMDYDLIFNVNLRSHWSVIKYYIDNSPSKIVKYIMIGSSTYKQGRKKFILYAASRAALYSVWQGSSEFCSPNLILGIINPVRVNTKHVAKYSHPNPELCLEAIDVAEKIAYMARDMNTHECIDMDYKEKT